MALGVVDIHSHILPGVDDGSQNIEESLEMLRIAQQQGITDMILTPHHKCGRHNVSPEGISRRIAELKEAAAEEGLSVRLYPGNEVLYYSEMDEALEEGRIQRMDQSDYVLIEFLPHDGYSYIRNALDSVQSMGYRPILAHVERYACMLQSIEAAAELKDKGVSIQVNASSITGAVGWKVKRYVHHLLKEKIVDYIGTDAHDSRRRSPEIKECCKILYRKYDSIYVDRIIYQNAIDFLINQ